MPTYLLQWEAMRWAKARGCSVYDLWGVPDAEEAALEAGFAVRSDGLWGVYRFKRGFGGDLKRSAGAWDRAYLPSVPAGRYVLLVEPESPRPVNYRVRLTRDVPRALWFWLAVGLLGVPPLFFWWRQWRFEQRRWEESDHPMSGSSGGGSDDDDD